MANGLNMKGVRAAHIRAAAKEGMKFLEDYKNYHNPVSYAKEQEAKAREQATAGFTDEEKEEYNRRMDMLAKYDGTSDDWMNARKTKLEEQIDTNNQMMSSVIAGTTSPDQKDYSFWEDKTNKAKDELAEISWVQSMREGNKQQKYYDSLQQEQEKLSSDDQKLLKEYLQHKDLIEHGVMGQSVDPRSFAKRDEEILKTLQSHGHSEEEIQNYLEHGQKLYNKETVEAANEAWDEWLRSGSKPEQFLKGAFGDFVSIIGSPAQAAAGLYNTIDAATGTASGKYNDENPVDTYGYTYRPQRTTNKIQETISDEILHTTDNETLNTVLNTLHSGFEAGASSGFQMALASAIATPIAAVAGGGEAAAGLAKGISEVINLTGFGASKFSSSLAESQERGLSHEQGLKLATMQAINEVLFEKVSLDALWGKIMSGKAGSTAVKDVIMDGLGQAAIEGSEEVATSFADELADLIVSKDKSEYTQAVQNYMAKGKTRKEAESLALRDFLGDVAQDFAAGMISGGLMGGNVSSMRSAIRTNRTASNVDTETMREVQELAMDSDGAAGEIARSKDVEDMTNAEKGTLLQAAYEKSENPTELLTESFIEKGYSESDAKAGAELVQEVLKTDPETMTEEEEKEIQEKIAQSPVAEDFYQVQGEVYKGEISTPVNNLLNRVEAAAESQVKAKKNRSNTVDRIERVKEGSDGNFSFEMAGGRNVEAGDLNLDSEGEKLVQFAMSADTAKEATMILRNKPVNMPASLYTKAFNRIKSAAIADIPLSKIKEEYGEYTHLMTEPELTAIYQAGKTLAKDLSRKNLNAENREIVKILSEVTGVPVKIGGHEGEGLNGFYQNGTIHISGDTANPAGVVFGHEFVHSLRGSNEDLYQRLKKESTDWLKKVDPEAYDDILYNRMQRYKDQIKQWMGEGVSSEEMQNRMDEELTAHMTEAVFEHLSKMNDEELRDYFEDLVERDRSLAEKILDFLRDLIEKIKNALKGYKATSMEARKLSENLEQLEVFEQTLAEVMKEAGERNAANQQQSVSDKQAASVKESRKSFAEEYDAWDKKDPTKHFHIGVASKVLQGIGIEEREIILDSKKVARIKRKHAEMTDDMIKKLPALVADPIVVMKSQNKEGRIVLAGELEDADGNPIIAVLELHPKDKRNLELDEIKLVSAYGKEDFQEFLNDSEILYETPDKKRTKGWRFTTGVYFPVVSPASGSNDIVRPSNKKSNTKKAQKDSSMKSLKESVRETENYEDLVMKGTGEKISKEFANVLQRLDNKEKVSLQEFDAIPEVAYAVKKLATIPALSQEESEAKRPERIAQLKENNGFANPKDMVYNGSVERGFKAYLVLGLSASGKSSVISDRLLKENKAFLLDSDEAKKTIPEFNNGWGGDVVHEESKRINKELLKSFIDKTSEMNGANVVMPIVGSNARKVLDVMQELKEAGYSVGIHLVEVSPETSLSRLLKRYISDNRFIDPKIVIDYGTKPSEVFEQVKGEADEYSKWSNEVSRGENPIHVSSGGKKNQRGEMAQRRRGGGGNDKGTPRAESTAEGEVDEYSKWSNEVARGENPIHVASGGKENQRGEMAQGRGVRGEIVKESGGTGSEAQSGTSEREKVNSQNDSSMKSLKEVGEDSDGRNNTDDFDLRFSKKEVEADGVKYELSDDGETAVSRDGKVLDIVDVTGFSVGKGENLKNAREAAKRAILELRGNNPIRIASDGREVYLRRRTGREYSNSAHTKHLSEEKRRIKFSAAKKIIDIIEKASNPKWTPDKGGKHGYDAERGWTYYDIDFLAKDGNQYEYVTGRLNVMMSGDGKDYVDDVNEIKTEAAQTDLTLHGEQSPSDSNISPSEQKINNKPGKISEKDVFGKRLSLKDEDDMVDRLTAEEERLGLDSRDAWLRFMEKISEKDAEKLVSMATAKKIAQEMKRDYNSEIKTDEFAGYLQKVFSYWVKNGKTERKGKEILDLITGLSRPFMDQIMTVDETMKDEYENFRTYLDNLGTVRLSDSAASDVGDLSDFNKALKKHGIWKFNVSKNKGIPLDNVWKELVEMSGGTLDELTNEGDQAPQLLEALNDMRPQKTRQDFRENGMTEDQMAVDIAMDIVGRYMARLSDLKTDAKLEREIEELKAKRLEYRKALRAEFENKLEALRQEELTKREDQRAWVDYKLDAARNNLASAKAAGDEAAAKHYENSLKYYQKRSDEIRNSDEAHREEILRLKARYRNEFAQRRKNYEIQQKRASIARTAKQITTLFNTNTDKKHVPEVLKEPVNAFIGALKFYENESSAGAREWAEKLRKMKDLLNNSKAAQDDGFYGTYLNMMDGTDEEGRQTSSLLDGMQSFLDENSNVLLRNMTLTQLAQLDSLVKGLKKAIDDTNRLYVNKRSESVEQIGEGTIQELQQKKDRKDPLNILKPAKRLLNVSQLDARSYFYRLGDNAMSIYKGLREGLNRRVWHIKEAQDYMNDVAKGIDMKNWTGKNAKIHEFDLNGRKLTMTTGQIMALYETSKRNQARLHLLIGGIKPGDIERTGKTITAKRAERLTEYDIERITSVLTEEQKRVADAMQQFLEKECSKWGNETTMQLYGYKRFGAKNYFPMKADKSTVDLRDTSRYFGVKNQGFTKETIRNARNPLVIGDIFDIFTNHVTDMATYNAYTAPMMDAMKWFNYRQGIKEDTDTTGVQAEINSKYGEDMQKYFQRLIQDINGGVSSDSGDLLAYNKLVSGAKAAAVGANLRVIIQQPTAYLRAMAVMNPKYLLRAIGDFKQVKESQKHSAIAQWKSWGYFETAIGQSMKSVITGSQTAKEKLVEKMMAGAQIADDLTWGALWKACCLETKDKYPDLAPGSDEFYKVAAERFDDVVDQTQVVDSTLHRSQLMRSKSEMVKSLTAFMSEPTKSYNLLMNRLRDVSEKKPGARKAFTRAAAAFAITAVVNAAAQSIVDAFRYHDRDEYKDLNYWERWLAKWQDNVKDGLNPLNLIPILKDVWSLFQGNSNDQLWTQGIGKLVNGAGKMLKWKNNENNYRYEHNFWDTFKPTLQGLSYVTGVPAYNLERDMEAIFETVTGLEVGGERYSNKENYERIAEALITDDEVLQKDATEYLEEKGVKEDSVESGVKSALKEKYINGEITEDQYKEILINDYGEDPKDVYFKIQEINYKETHPEEEYHKWDEITDAYLSGSSSYDSLRKEMIENGVDEKAIDRGIGGEVKDRFEAGEITDKQYEKWLRDSGKDQKEIFQELEEMKVPDSEEYNVHQKSVDAAVSGNKSAYDARMKELTANGYSREDVDKAVKSKVGKMYESGEITEDKLKRFAKDFLQMNEEETLFYLEKERYKKTNGSDDGYRKWGNAAEELLSGERKFYVKYEDAGIEFKKIRNGVNEVYQEEIKKLVAENRLTADIQAKYLDAWQLLNYKRDEKLDWIRGLREAA